jgi:hypothetical protein
LRRWLFDSLNQYVAIVAWLVDHSRHRVHIQFQAGASGEQV